MDFQNCPLPFVVVTVTVRRRYRSSSLPHREEKDLGTARRRVSAPRGECRRMSESAESAESRRMSESAESAESAESHQNCRKSITARVNKLFPNKTRLVTLLARLEGLSHSESLSRINCYSGVSLTLMTVLTVLTLLGRPGVSFQQF